MPFFRCENCGEKLWSDYNHEQFETVVCGACGEDIKNPYYEGEQDAQTPSS